jgi:hypothetical protein
MLRESAYELGGDINIHDIPADREGTYTDRNILPLGGPTNEASLRSWIALTSFWTAGLFGGSGGLFPFPFLPDGRGTETDKKAEYGGRLLHVVVEGEQAI